jgi:CRISPR-associated protein Csb1
MDLEKLLSEKRLLLEAELVPVQGERFQPTGFPELGPAAYTLPDGTEMLMVESAQSVANRLEAVCWDSSRQEPQAPLEGMPYVSVHYEGKELTNSLLEAHRLNSSYILGNTETEFFKMLQEELSGLQTGPIDERALAGVVVKYDPNALIHGIFFARKELAGGRLRLPRLLSGFIEAQDIRPVESGGVKNDRVEPRASAKLGFGNVPYARTEYVATTINVYFNFDLQRLASYCLERETAQFIVAFSLWKVRRFLDVGLRLRTACDLTLKSDIKVTAPQWFTMPPAEAIEAKLPELLAAAKGFAEPALTVVQFEPPKNWLKEEKDEELE